MQQFGYHCNTSKINNALMQVRVFMEVLLMHDIICLVMNEFNKLDKSSETKKPRTLNIPLETPFFTDLYSCKLSKKLSKFYFIGSRALRFLEAHIQRFKEVFP